MAYPNFTPKPTKWMQSAARWLELTTAALARDNMTEEMRAKLVAQVAQKRADLAEQETAIAQAVLDDAGKVLASAQAAAKVKGTK